MSFLWLSCIAVVIGLLPLGYIALTADVKMEEKISRGTVFAALVVLAVILACGNALLLYVALPALYLPLWGVLGLEVLVIWLVIGVSSLNSEEHKWLILFPIGLMLAYAGIWFWNLPLMNAEKYAAQLGKVSERVWSEDVQPPDPKHIRLVSLETAIWMADKELGQAKESAIGSSFQIAKEQMTLQMINGALWYVAPLDFKGYRAWSATNGKAPGYLKVSAEDPNAPAVLVTGEAFAYMPGAFFGNNLSRHLWSNGYASKGIDHYTFEIDEEGKPWWIVTVYENSLGWSAPKVQGVVQVDPTTGAHTYIALADIPKWVDRVFPDVFVQQYINDRGDYDGGWWNAWWGHLNITNAGTVSLVYGANGEPHWVTDITSNNARDNSLVGLIYTNSRTGESVLYKASGSTQEGSAAAVNSKVSYKNLHAAPGTIYNLYGKLTEVIPIVGAKFTFEGVAIVEIDTMQVAIGDNLEKALKEYEKLLGKSGDTTSIVADHEASTLRGCITRISADNREGNTTYLFMLKGVPIIFSGTSALSSTLPLTKVGDCVEVTYIEEGVVTEFKNTEVLSGVPASQSVSQPTSQP